MVAGDGLAYVSYILSLCRQYDLKLDFEQRRQLALRGKTFDDLPSFKGGPAASIELPSAQDV